MATFVFLHGSFHATWNWHRVIPLLEAAGHRGIALDLPGHGSNCMAPRRATLARNVKCVCDRIDAASVAEEIVLVAHSRNGIVISQTAEARPRRISGLVYLAAYLVPNGSSMMDYALDDTASLVLQNVETPLPPAMLRFLVRFFKSGAMRWLGGLLLPYKMQIHSLKKQAYRSALYHDCGEEIVELANALLEAEPNWAGFQKLRLSEAKYGSVPKIYIECLQDRAVTLGMQRRMQADSKCDCVMALVSSHSPFFSQPEKLVAALKDCLPIFASSLSKAK